MRAPVGSGPCAHGERIGATHLDLGTSSRRALLVLHLDVEGVLGTELEIETPRARNHDDHLRCTRSPGRLGDDPVLGLREVAEGRSPLAIGLRLSCGMSPAIEDRERADVRTGDRASITVLRTNDHIEDPVAASDLLRDRRRDELHGRRTQRRARPPRDIGEAEQREQHGAEGAEGAVHERA
ncbi:MAG: hypothetical protein K0S65_6819 [Labilithrix sp.]|nr:hypothetical protein [Labilithrix sp.]